MMTDLKPLIKIIMDYVDQKVDENMSNLRRHAELLEKDRMDRKVLMVEVADIRRRQDKILVRLGERWTEEQGEANAMERANEG